MNYEDLTVKVKIPESASHTWKYRDVMEYPDAARPRQRWDPLRLRAIGVRSDGEVFQITCYISQMGPRPANVVGGAEEEMLKLLDKFLITKTYMEY